jgi:hypothetical protein
VYTKEAGDGAGAVEGEGRVAGIVPGVEGVGLGPAVTPVSNMPRMRRRATRVTGFAVCRFCIGDNGYTLKTRSPLSPGSLPLGVVCR